jgi:hypothetical protein
MGNTIYDYWGTVDTARTDPLSLINIDTLNCRVSVQSNVLRTNAVTSSSAGILNINGGRYLQTGGNVIEYFGSDTSDSGTYGVLGGLVMTSTPNDYNIFGDDRVLGNIGRGVWLRNCESVKISGTMIRIPVGTAIYTDNCTNIIVSDITVDNAATALFVKDTTTLILTDSVLTPSTYNISWSGTNQYAKVKNIITSKYSNLNAWSGSNAYVAGDRVRRAAFVWRCVANHTSASANRPGDSTGWGSAWKMEGFSQAPNSSREMVNSGTEPADYSEDTIIQAT